MTFTNPTTITFVVYMLAMIGIGFAAWRYTRNLSDYILGGRSLGSFVTAAINDRTVDLALGLAPLREAAVALVGFGPRAAERRVLELDDYDPVRLAPR